MHDASIKQFGAWKAPGRIHPIIKQVDDAWHLAGWCGGWYKGKQLHLSKNKTKQNKTIFLHD